MRRGKRVIAAAIAATLVTAIVTTAGGAVAEPDPGGNQPDPGGQFELDDPNDGLEELDSSNSNVLSSSSSSSSSSDGIELEGRGVRNEADATTDVAALGDYAYTGTFQSPCGGEPGAGVWVWDVDDEDNPTFVTVIPSPTGSRANDVRVAAMNSGDILVHSNESCGGGRGGFEIYDIDDPTSPALLASIQIDEINPVTDAAFGGLTDVGVHNLFLFTQGTTDYVGVTAGTAFDNFQIFDISNPSVPVLVGHWGAEDVFDAGVGDSLDPARVFPALNDLFDGFGNSQNKFLHDATVSADGTRAYLASWDAGLILLDISDVTSPALVSVALDVANGSLDGEVNSHAVWPSEDGAIVVEGEEDFSAWEATVPPSNLTMDAPTPGDPTIPGTAISTFAGDDFTTYQTGNIGTTDGTSVTVASGPLAGNTYAANELATAAGSPTFATTGPLTGELVFIGQACSGDTVLNPGAFDAGDIAVVRRGACFFEEKENTAAALGASAVIIANNNPVSTPWSGLRIWDYSNPAAPVLASVFNTVCSASTGPGGPCDENGTYSVHNVVVETVDGRTLAYVSWYFDGILILDVTDPYSPVEIARYLDTSGPNAGLANDFWGVFKEPGSDELYTSDRNGGLYIFDVDDVVEDYYGDSDDDDSSDDSDDDSSDDSDDDD